MRILFVCSGNVFRSLAAEYCLNDYAIKNKLRIKATSAGITAKPQEIHQATIKALMDLGIKPLNHKQRKITKEIINKADIIIAMSNNHQEYLKKKFNINAPLFNELVTGQSKGILDIHEALINEDKNSIKTNNYITEVINHISKSINKLVDNFIHK